MKLWNLLAAPVIFALLTPMAQAEPRSFQAKLVKAARTPSASIDVEDVVSKFIEIEQSSSNSDEHPSHDRISLGQEGAYGLSCFSDHHGDLLSYPGNSVSTFNQGSDRFYVKLAPPRVFVLQFKSKDECDEVRKILQSTSSTSKWRLQLSARVGNFSITEAN